MNIARRKSILEASSGEVAAEQVDESATQQLRRLRGKQALPMERRPRESYSCWFARVSAAEARSKAEVPLKQLEYMALWRDMAHDQQETWKEQHSFRSCANTEQEEHPVAEEGDTRDLPDAAEETPLGHLHLPEGYTPRQLVLDFTSISASHSLRLQNPDKRYRMYAFLALLLEAGTWSSLKTLLVDKKLKCLFIKRHKLQTVQRMLRAAGFLLEECPVSFRTGRSAPLQFSDDEKLELLEYVKHHAQYAIPLTVQQVKTHGLPI